jgi:hypothetical protein
MQYSMNYRNRVYIAGRVSGRLVHEVRMEFYHRQLKLEDEGYKTYNPVERCSMYWSWRHCMVVNLLNLIFRCNKISLLPGWEYSRGANIEYKVAKFLRYKLV